MLEQAMHLHQDGRLDEAEAGYRGVLARDRDHVDALHFLGVIALQRGRQDEAEALIRQALQRHEGNVPARTNLGKVHQARGELAQAIACYRQALEFAPDYVDASMQLGRALNDDGRPAEAIPCFRRAAALRPEFAEAHCDLGTALVALRRMDEAIAAYREALRIRPDFLAARYNLGIALREQHRTDEAIACFRATIELKRDFAEGHYGLGQTLCDGDRTAEARACFERALSLRPDFAEARWSLAMSRLPGVPQLGDDPTAQRREFAQDLAGLERWFEGERAASGHRAVGVQQPFALAYQDEDNRELLSRYGRLCVRLMAQSPEGRNAPPPRGQRRAGPVRIGFVSQHFRNHSVWNAIVRGWVDQIDRERFAISAFYLGVEEDAETQFARSRVAHFAGGPLDLTRWVDAILEQRPEVLIYPEIGMDPVALKLASLRLAPVQVATWGHPETTGLPTIDYYVSAQGLEPEDAQSHYAERLIELPNLGVHLDPPARVAVGALAGAPELDREVPLLICPGTPFKYAPGHDRIFPQIARRLGNCKFVFFEHWTPGLSERLHRRLRAAFDDAGLDCARHVAFIPWQPKGAFYGLMQRASVFLDTIGFSGFNTALQAIDCGLPLVTVEGRFLRGRLASGILRRAGLDELVTASAEDYVERAVRLVADPNFNREMRARISARRDVLYRDRETIRALEDFLEDVGARRGG